jgi:hypothetical protein
VHFFAGRKNPAAPEGASLERPRAADATLAAADDAQDDDPSVRDVDGGRATSPDATARSASATPPPPPATQRRASSPPGIASGDELIEGRPQSDEENNVRAVEHAEQRLAAKAAEADPAKKRPHTGKKAVASEPWSDPPDTDSDEAGPQKRRKSKKPKNEPQVLVDSDDSADHNRASTSRHKPVTSSAIYNAFDGAVLQDVRRRFQTLIFARDGWPARTLTPHRALNYKLTLKAAKDTMEQGLYKQFKNQMEAAYKDTSKE